MACARVDYNRQDVEGVQALLQYQGWVFKPCDLGWRQDPWAALLKMMKNAFYFILKGHFVFKVFTGKLGNMIKILT